MSSNETPSGAVLREIFERPETVVMPMGALPIHARMAERAGFEAFWISGGMTAWWMGGVADVGYLTLTEVAAHARRIARSVDIPIYCDADTGYGTPMNVQRTVEEFIHAGVAGMHIEDQQEPKKSGGMGGVKLVSDAEAIARLNAAVDARDRLGADFMIVARTDGYGATGNVDEAIRRGQLYRAETGVDAIFFEGMETWEEIELALKETPGSNHAIGTGGLMGRKTLPELTAIGQAIEVVPFLLPGVPEVWRLLVDIKEAGDTTPFAAYVDGMAKDSGTKYDVGWGADLVEPSEEALREFEAKYIPDVPAATQD